MMSQTQATVFAGTVARPFSAGPKPATACILHATPEWGATEQRYGVDGALWGSAHQHNSHRHSGRDRAFCICCPARGPELLSAWYNLTRLEGRCEASFVYPEVESVRLLAVRVCVHC